MTQVATASRASMAHMMLQLQEGEDEDLWPGGSRETTMSPERDTWEKPAVQKLRIE